MTKPAIHDNAVTRSTPLNQQRSVTLSTRVALVLACVILTLLAYVAAPRLLWAYHIERAGRLMEASIAWPDPRQADSLPTLLDDQALTQVLRHLTAAQRWRPEHPHAFRLEGQVYATQSEWSRAAAALEQARTLAPNNPVILWETSLVYEQMWHRVAGAAHTPLRVATGMEDSASVASSEQRSRNRTLASADPASYTAFTPDTRTLEAWQTLNLGAAQFLERGEQARQAKRYVEALRWYNRALLVDPEQSGPWYRAGLVYVALKEWNDALYALQKASVLSPENRDIWYELGTVHMNRKEPDAALDAFERGLRADAGETGLSILYYQIGRVRQDILAPPDLAGAWAAYEQALALDDYAGAPALKANVYFMRGRVLAAQQRWEAAIQESQQALELNPQHYWAQLDLAGALVGLGQTTAAREQLLRAIELRPDTKNAYLMLGSLYRTEGDFQQARAMYTRVLKLDPQDAAAHAALEALNKDDPLP